MSHEQPASKSEGFISHEAWALPLMFPLLPLEILSTFAGEAGEALFSFL